MLYIRRLYFSIHGRAGRLSYNLFFVVPFFLMGTILGFFSPRDSHSALVVFVAFLLLTLWPVIAMNTKRLHDVDLSGWWLIALWGAPLGVKLLFARYGTIHGYLVSVVAAVLLMAWPGTNGPNKYGPKP